MDVYTAHAFCLLLPAFPLLSRMDHGAPSIAIRSRSSIVALPGHLLPMGKSFPGRKRFCNRRWTQMNTDKLPDTDDHELIRIIECIRIGQTVGAKAYWIRVYPCLIVYLRLSYLSAVKSFGCGQAAPGISTSTYRRVATRTSQAICMEKQSPVTGAGRLPVPVIVTLILRTSDPIDVS